MRIWLGSFLLAGGDRESPSGLTMDQDRLVQAVDFIGAEYGANLARGQRRHTIQFSVARLHSTLEEAESFVLTHPDEVPNSGTLTFEATGGRLTRWIADAVCARVSLLEHVGLHTRWSYALVGGQVLVRNPETET